MVYTLSSWAASELIANVRIMLILNLRYYICIYIRFSSVSLIRQLQMPSTCSRIVLKTRWKLPALTIIRNYMQITLRSNYLQRRTVYHVEKLCRIRRWKFAFQSRSARNSLRSHCTYVSACVLLLPWRVRLYAIVSQDVTRSSTMHFHETDHSRIRNVRGKNQSSICDIASGGARTTRETTLPLWVTPADWGRPGRPRLSSRRLRASSAIFGLRANFAPRPTAREISRARSMRKIQTSGLRSKIYSLE